MKRIASLNLAQVGDSHPAPRYVAPRPPALPLARYMTCTSASARPGVSHALRQPATVFDAKLVSLTIEWGTQGECVNGSAELRARQKFHARCVHTEQGRDSATD
jgi:hypothetical protein